MSIASEEANNLYSKPDERTIGRSNLFDFEELRSYQRAAYQRGRTAEPTEAEIGAALPELLAAYRQESDMVTDRDYVKRILEAARKAVAESWERES